MSGSDKMLKIIDRLHQHSVEGKVIWRETERTDSFQVSFSGYSVRTDVRRSRKTPGAQEYFVSVLNANGDVMEEIGDEDLEDYFVLMKELFEMARRKALGVDGALDQILDELGE